MDEKLKKNKKTGLKNETLLEVITVGIFLCMRSLYFVFLSFTDMNNGEYTGLLKSFQNRGIAPIHIIAFTCIIPFFIICVFETEHCQEKKSI